MLEMEPTITLHQEHFNINHAPDERLSLDPFKAKSPLFLEAFKNRLAQHSVLP